MDGGGIGVKGPFPHSTRKLSDAILENSSRIHPEFIAVCFDVGKEPSNAVNATERRRDMQGGHRQISGDVRVSGVINDYEFSAEGEATGNPSTGEYSVKLDYTDVPKGLHPLMYMYGVHFGLGLTPYTEFHLDLVCTPVSVSAQRRKEKQPS